MASCAAGANDSLDVFTTRLRKDIESLLPTLAPAAGADEDTKASTWHGRIENHVRHWSAGRFALVLTIGMLSTVAAVAAIVGFSAAIETSDPPAIAYALRYLLIALAVTMPAAMMLVIWWWYGRRRVDPSR